MTKAIAAEADATAASWYGLAILVLVSLYGVVDRQVFILMAEPIRAQLALTDFQLGMLQGLGVSLFVAVAGYPIGWMADRYDRRKVLAGCIIVWSVSVACCGLAQSFSQLFLASAMVGAGESGLTPIVFALIPELFRNEKRLLANSVNIAAGRLGYGLAIAFCGLLTVFADSARPLLPAALQDLPSWRLTFFAAALPAPLFVILLLTLPVRARAGSARSLVASAGAGAKVPLVGLVDFLGNNRAGVGGTFAAISCVSFGLVAVGTWMPVVAMRQFGTSPVGVSSAIGTATVIASTIGLVFTVFGVRWLAPRVGVRLPVLAMAASCGLGGLVIAMLPLTTTADQLFLVYGVQLTFLMLGFMVYPTALQSLAPAHLRSRIFAIFAVVAIVIPSAAPPLVGLLSDYLKDRPNGLELAMVSAAVTALWLGTAVFIWVGKHYESSVRAASTASHDE